MNCKPDEELSIRTRRCIKKCKSGYFRNHSTGRCKKNLKNKTVNKPKRRTSIKRQPDKMKESLVKYLNNDDDIQEPIPKKYDDLTSDQLNRLIHGIEIDANVIRNYFSLILPKYMREKGYNGLLDWNIALNNKLKNLCKCNHKTKTLEFNSDMLFNSFVDFDDIQGVILHAIAHANVNAKYKVNNSKHNKLYNDESLLIGTHDTNQAPLNFALNLIELVVYKCRNPINKCTHSSMVRNNTKNILTTKRCPHHNLIFFPEMIFNMNGTDDGYYLYLKGHYTKMSDSDFKYIIDNKNKLLSGIDYMLPYDMLFIHNGEAIIRPLDESIQIHNIIYDNKNIKYC